MKQDIKEGDGNTQIGVEGDVKGDIIVNPKPLPQGPYTVPCPNCRYQVSSLSETCPICGHPVKKHLQKERLNNISKQLQPILIFLSVVLLIIILLSRVVSHPILNWLKFVDGGILVFVFFFYAIVKEKINE